MVVHPLQRRAIQLTDFIPANATDDDQRLVAALDGSLKLAKPHQKFFEVAPWAAMAMTSAIQFVELDRQRDPRLVNFNLLQYLAYLQTTFLKFKRFKFKQVLLYDRAYRVLQLRERWTWNTYIPELYESHLAGHHRIATPFKEAKKRSSVVTNSSWVDRTCNTFNSGNQCKYNPCKFLHQCSICQQHHPASGCPLIAGKGKAS